MHCKLHPKDNWDALTAKLEKEARQFCAIQLMQEATRQTKLAQRFRRKRLAQAAQMTQSSAWAFHLSAAFLLAATPAAGRS